MAFIETLTTLEEGTPTPISTKTEASPLPLNTQSCAAREFNAIVEGIQTNGVEGNELRTDLTTVEGDISTAQSDISTLQSTVAEMNDVSIKPSGPYSLLATDNVIEIDGPLTIPTGLGAGYTCSIFLNNAAAQTITTTGLTIRGTPGTSIDAYGLINVLAIAADVFWIKGETV